jgi:hypothetical protein
MGRPRLSSQPSGHNRLYKSEQMSVHNCTEDKKAMPDSMKNDPWAHWHDYAGKK